jgi:hypothetical protein
LSGKGFESGESFVRCGASVPLARFIKLFRREEREAHFSLITITIPFWQCFPWEQYNQIGVVLLTMIVYVGVVVDEALTGMKVDCVTVWLLGANWNCTMSPTLALTLLGL